MHSFHKSWLMAVGFFLGISSLFTLNMVNSADSVNGIQATGVPHRIEFMPAAQVANGEVEVVLEDAITGGLDEPIGLVNAGDGSGRLFIHNKNGTIQVYKTGVLLGTYFLDISSKVSAQAERGLLGLAFHPNYENNGTFYVLYTRNPDGSIIVSRFQVSADPDVADPASEFQVLEIDHPLSIHNGGQLAFGPDGNLYIGIGDSDEQGDPNNHAQRLDLLYGKILRINVDDASPYSIPSDNPFVGQEGKRGEIWVYGLRNPWRFSFDRQNGELLIGDVGLNNWEEIDHSLFADAFGTNFGWRCFEGTHVFNNTDPPCNDPLETAKMVPPIAEIQHGDGNSITGGYVYRGVLSPGLTGKYFFADYITGKIWSMEQTSPGVWSAPQVELTTSMNFVSFGEDEQGEIYVVDLGDEVVKRLKQKGSEAIDMSETRITSSLQTADPGQVVTYTLNIQNSGFGVDDTLYASIHVPDGLAYQPGSLAATGGTANDSESPVLKWEGQLLSTDPVTVTYQVLVKNDTDTSQLTVADFNGINYLSFSRKHVLQVPKVFLQTTLNDFILPGSQPGSLQDAISLPTTCDVCHTEPISGAWSGSMMSLAGHNPLFWSALEVANRDAPDSGEFCLRCHVPKGWIEGRSNPSDGSALLTDDLISGVGCGTCHRAVEPVLVSDDEASARDAAIRNALALPPPSDHQGSAMMVIDPLDYRRGPFPLGPGFGNHPNQTFATDFLGRLQNDYVSRSRLCGSCHNVDNPAISWDEQKGQFWPNDLDQPAPDVGSGMLFPVETTYDEWLYSEFASTGVVDFRFSGDLPDGRVGACADCHMRRSTGIAAEDSLDPIYRDCAVGGTGCLPVHEFIGGNGWVPEIVQDDRWRLNKQDSEDRLQLTIDNALFMLSKAAELEVQLEQVAGGKVARVRVTNHSGHKLPTGYAEGRRMWIHLRALDSDSNQVYESGAYDFSTGELTKGPDVKIYEALQGITPDLAAELGLPEGESFHFVLNNTVTKDNRIPPRGYTQSAYDRPGLRPVGAVYADGQYWDEVEYSLPAETNSVIVTLYYQTSSKEYIEFLSQNGGVDSQTLFELWNDSKSPPVIMARVFTPSLTRYLPFMPQKRR